MIGLIFGLAIVGILLGACAFAECVRIHRRLDHKDVPLGPFASQADLDEMRTHVIECINAVNVLAAETGHSSVAPAAPTGEYRSPQSYQR